MVKTENAQKPGVTGQLYKEVMDVWHGNPRNVVSTPQVSLGIYVSLSRR